MSSIFTNIQRPCTILAPTYMHREIRAQILQETCGLIGINLLSLQAFLQNHLSEAIDNNTLLFNYRQEIKNAGIHGTFSSICETLDFLRQCQAFLQELKLYDCKMEDLPQDTPTQQELKAILELLYPIQTNQDLENEWMATFSKKDAEQIYILNALWSYPDHYRIEKLCRLGAKRLAFPNKLQTTSYVSSINKRKEIEAAAQQIIQDNHDAQDIRIAVCDNTYVALIKQIFQRYHIPFTSMKQTKASNISIQFQRFFQYYYEPTTQHLIDLIHSGICPSHHQKDFLEYLEIFQKSIEDHFTHIKDHAKSSQLISAYDIERLLRLETNARTYKELLVPPLTRVCSIQDPKELCLTIDEIIRNNAYKEQDTTIWNSIHHILETYLPYFHDKDDIPFLLELLDDVKETQSPKRSYGVMISTIQEPFQAGKLCMIMGATQSNYPAYPIKTGLFDESYIQNIPAYPTIQQRNQLHRCQLEQCLRTFEVLRVSFPIASYQGKTNESALEMDQFMRKDAIIQEPLECNTATQVSQTLQEALARKLFLKDGKLYGSISAFERYMKCPFSYFLTYGLRIKEPIEYDFSPGRIGTLSHYILETLVNQYGKDYPNAPLVQIESLIHSQLEHMVDIYPSYRHQLPLLKQRLLKTITYNLEYLKEMEDHSHIAPFACEKEFWWDIPTNNDDKLCFHGFIDRIDASEGYLRIIDYKSSPKSLSPSDVFAGLQLQLLAYALYAKTMWQKEVLGVYYYSFLIDTIPAAAGKMKQRPVEYVKYNHNDYKLQKDARHRLNGWTFHKDAEIIDDDGTHILGLRKNKDGVVSVRTIHDLDQCDKDFQTMMNKISEAILQGNIQCAPIKDACTFCAFSPICRFHGYWRKPQPLVSQEGDE